METATAAMEKPVSGRKAQTSSSSFPAALLQRKCACGGTATSAPQGECEECRKKKLQRRATDWREIADVPPIVEEVLESSGQALDSATREFMEPRFGHDFSRVRVHTDYKASESAKAVNALAYTVGHNVVFAGGQYAPGKKSGQKLLAHELTHVLQQRKMGNAAPQSKLQIGPANDSLEQEADCFAEKVAGVSATATAPSPTPPAGSSSGPRPLLQRAPADQSIPATAPKVAAPGLIVDDEVQELADGQMHKTEFLDKLHAEVCNTAESALKPAGRTASGCPFIEKWITRLRGQTSRHVERAIRKYAPEGAGAKTAADYIPPVGAKVQEGVSRWAATGEISGVPPELMAEAMGGGILGAMGSALSGLVSGIGGVLSSVGHLFTKANPGGARAGDPAAIQAQLNSSPAVAPLESGVKSRMEAAFGHSFDRVRVHADSRSAQLSSSLNARAFAIGHDVAFATGEYQPGTLLGDALIAHELAHVIQQDGDVAGPMAKGGTEYNNLEEDADISAVSAMYSMWSGAKGSLRDIGKNAMPRLRSGLKLQRCGRDPVSPVDFKLAQTPEGTPCTAEQRQSETDPYKSCCTADMLKEIQGHMSYAKAYVENAIIMLAKPSDGDVTKALMDNFQIRPDDKRVSTVLSGLTAISASMGNVPFRCRSKAEDPECARDFGRTSFDATHDTPQPYITLCGHYPGEKSKLPPDIARELQGTDAGKFLPEKAWVKTLIHEHAHVGAKGNINMPPSGEFYKCRDKYPQEAEKNLINADCYAWFAMDLSNSGFKCG